MYRTRVARAISPYALWLQKSKGDFADAPSIGDRARLVANAYRALGPAEKESLYQEARATPFVARQRRLMTPFALFMKGRHFPAAADARQRTAAGLVAYKALPMRERDALAARASELTKNGTAKRDSPGKARRKPTKYNNFVKESFESVKALPRNERLKAIAERWEAHKAAFSIETPDTY
jgi:hypothetical protein